MKQEVTHMRDAVKIHPADDVAVAVRPLKQGEQLCIAGQNITVAQDVPAGHKLALHAMAKGDTVHKYGNPIGHTTAAVPAGGWIHTMNLATNLQDELTYTYSPLNKPLPAKTPDSFLGFVRGDGKVGVRNYVWIIPTVGCVNKICTALERMGKAMVQGSVTDVVAFTHPYGCSQMTQDQENTRHILAGLIRHPNAGGVLVVGLGCENTNIEVLKPYLGDFDPARIRFLNCQDEQDEYARGEELLGELCGLAARDTRTPVSTEKLVVGLKCGGSDGFSGITANPVIGGFSDMLVQRGGTTMLTEVTEMFGAEPLLMNRCESRQVFDQTVAMINGFKRYCIENGQTIYENPSPGNKAGGISTLEDKSLGCTQKCGEAPIRGVVEYGGTAKQTGLLLLSSPANDLVASTALAAAGAQIVLFSTGRGTPFACPVPTVKIATNRDLARHKANWIDFDASPVLEECTYEEVSARLYDFVKQVSNGKLLKSEEQGLHDLAIFKSGVTV